MAIKRTRGISGLALLAWLALPATLAWTQQKEDTTVRSSADVLNEIMADPLQGIPRSMVGGAQGIAILPNLIKGGFIVGARFGRGVLLVRDETGNWQSPTFITLTGGNIGWQIGLQATDLILVFKTRQSVQGIMSGKLTLGADVAAAAGPVGRQAAAATDGRLKAEIYSYSRSRGLFAGVSVDGSVLQIDTTAHAAYYRAAVPGGPAIVPESAIGLVSAVTAYCGAGASQPAAAAPPQPAVSGQLGAADSVRSQLAQAAPGLRGLLDKQWDAYLALPAELFTANGQPSADALRQSLAHFDAVASDPRYRSLAERAEFQTTYGLLRSYAAARSQAAGPLQLPPPPVEIGSHPQNRSRY